MAGGTTAAFPSKDECRKHAFIAMAELEPGAFIKEIATNKLYVTRCLLYSK